MRHAAFDIIVTALAAMALAGCSSWHGDYATPDGTRLSVGGLDLFQQKRIGSVSAAGPHGETFTLTDLQRSGDADLFKAAMDGAAKVTGAAVGAAIK